VAIVAFGNACSQSPLREASASMYNLVRNGGFEDGLNGWELEPPKTRARLVGLIGDKSHTGRFSLVVSGTGGAINQMFEPTPIDYDTALELYTYLEGENPQALLNFYFHPERGRGRYIIAIVVTTEDVSYSERKWEDPQSDYGGVLVTYTRNPSNTWMRISPNVYSLIVRHFHYSNPVTSGVQIESSQPKGQVYYDDISVWVGHVAPPSLPQAIADFLRDFAKELTLSILATAIVSIVVYQWRKMRARARSVA